MNLTRFATVNALIRIVYVTNGTHGAELPNFGIHEFILGKFSPNTFAFNSGSLRFECCDRSSLEIGQSMIK